MYEFDTHTRQLAQLENSVREAREYSVALPGLSARVILVLAALVIVGTLFGNGVI